MYLYTREYTPYVTFFLLTEAFEHPYSEWSGELSSWEVVFQGFFFLKNST